MRQCCFGVSSIRNLPSAGVLSCEHHAEVGLETPRKLAAQGLIATGHVTARTEELVQGLLSRLVNRPRRAPSKGSSSRTHPRRAPGGPSALCSDRAGSSRIAPSAAALSLNSRVRGVYARNHELFSSFRTGGRRAAAIYALIQALAHGGGSIHGIGARARRTSRLKRLDRTYTRARARGVGDHPQTELT